MTRGSAPTQGVWAETRSHLTGGGRLVRRAGWRLAGVLAISQIVILAVSIPLIQWLFRSALRAAGMTGLDLGQLQVTGSLPITIGLIVVITVVALWLVSLQFALFVIVLHRSRLGASPSLAGLGRELVRVLVKLMKPSSFPLATYLFLVLPLAGFGFVSTFTQGISLPQFITGELQKTTGGSLFVTGLFLVIAVANVRLALTLPVFVVTGATGRQATRASRRMTRGRTGFSVAIGVLCISAVATVLGVLLVVVALIPTILGDWIAPASSFVVAAFSLGAAQVLGATLAAGTTAWITGFLLSVFEANREGNGLSVLANAQLANAQLADAQPAEAGPSQPAEVSRSDRPWKLSVLGAAVLVAVLFSIANIVPMSQVAGAPATLVLAHRGYTPEGVENTIGSLDAAAKLGVDLVEMDVMQASDGGFVAMHDTSLGRLTGVNADVKDLTTAELTSLTVRDQLGHEERIPTFTEYVTRATELGMPLLIEIKLSGAETDDHVDLLVDELEALGVLRDHLYHSLDAASVARLKQLRPDLTVGYTMAFAAQDVPVTPADFIVVEQWTATAQMQQAARNAGLGFWVWTVNDDAGIRNYVRSEVDGIITDRADVVMQTRADVTTETGLSGTLFDALMRWVTVL